MSDPVTNVEIEDVLSSIRKLVADEKRVSSLPRKPANTPDRLVLTPAQRVTEPVVHPEKPAEPEMTPDPVLLTDPVPQSVGEKSDPHPMEDIPRTARLSDFGAVEGLFPNIDDLDAEEADAEAADSALPDEARMELDRLIEEEVAAALAGADLDPEDADHDDARALAEANTEDDAWSDMGWTDEAEEEWTVPEDEPEEVPEEEDAQETGSLQAPEPELPGKLIKSPPLSLEDKVAALGRLVARGSNDFEEERDTPAEEDSAVVSNDMTWPDQAPFDEMVEPEPEPASNVLRSEGAWPAPREPLEPEADHHDDEVPEDAPAPAAEPLAMQVDDAMLREMVLEIVRSELQGALGERITRNVRKLVRREIHRMLISQELD